MSEQHIPAPDDEWERSFFASLEHEFTDPHVTEVHEFARSVERELASKINPTKDERRRAIAAIDTEWDVYNEKTITISGVLRYPTKTDRDQHDTVVGLDVISNGFMFIREPCMHENGTPGERWRVAHSVITDHKQDPNTMIYAYVLLDELESVQLPFPSEAQGARRFMQELPAHAERIRNACGQGLEHALGALATQRISIDASDQMQHQRGNDWLAYLKKYLYPEIDARLPFYVATIQGPVKRFRDQHVERDEISEPTQMLVRLDNVILDVQERITDETGTDLAEQEYSIYLLLVDADSESYTKLLVPASSVVGFASVRALAHQIMRDRT